MSALAVERTGAVHQNPKSQGRLARYGAELSLLGLFGLSAAVICFQHQIFGRDIIVSGKTVRAYQFSGYADQANGGRSTLNSPRPLSWSCDLKSGYQWLLCGYEIVFDQDGKIAGRDLRNLESVSFRINYHGAAPTLRFSLKNEDPRYSRHGDRATAKVNKIEFSVPQGRHTFVFRPSDFSVADWWLSGKKLTPELGRTQLDNVVSADFESGSNAPAGRYDFELESLILRRSSLAPARLYLIVLGIWALLLPLYLLLRVRRARHETMERERAEAQVRAALASAKDSAEEASKAKSDFLASMSHELRTPLNAVLGYAQLLARADLGEDHLAAVRTIHRSGKHLLSLINELLDLSKIEAGRMELHSAPTDLRGAIEAVADMVRVRAQQKHLAFDFKVADEVPETVDVDEKILRQVLLNLLGNAVKFTSQGKVELRVSLLDSSQDHANIRFEVQDSGPGIPAHDLERIFRPFEQLGDAQQREGGTGLGLAISRKLTALMGGSIEVESRVGDGTRFWLDLNLARTGGPLRVGPSPEEAPFCNTANRLAPAAAGDRLRILAAEDNPTNQAILRALLGDADIHLAGDGAEAVAAFQQHDFDLVLMDVQMPKMSGVEATRAIRDLESGAGRPRTPIVALSANVMSHQIAEYRAAGMDAHLDKPIDVEQLYSLLQTIAAGLFPHPSSSEPVSQTG